MFNFLKYFFRLFSFIWILSKYRILSDLAQRVHRVCYAKFLLSTLNIIFYPLVIFKSKLSSGERLSKALQAMGPIYIKLGQTLSTRPDIIGEDIANQLRLLQDKLPEFDPSIAKQIIAEEFRTSVKNIFAKFEDKPVAAASIAQVHRAWLLSGEKVAVKILRPNIVAKYKNDVDFLEYVAQIATKLFKSTHKLKLHELIAVFKRSMECELDLKFEAAAASRIQDNFAKDHTLKIPKIYWQYTSHQILTTEWIDGVSIYEKKAIEELGLDCKQLATNFANIFFNQAHRDGFFHADLHPGNILVCPNGQIALIDFGIIGILPEQDRLAIAEILYGFLKRDYELVAKIHLKAGYIPPDTNLEYFAQSCRAVAEPIVGVALKDISVGNLFTQLFKVVEQYGMEAQPQLILLQKTMVTIEGIEQILDVDANMWQLIAPWMKKWAVKNISPEAKILRMAKNFFKDLLKLS